jgi:catalase
VEAALGMEGRSEPIQPAVPPRDLKPSPTLSLIRKAKSTLAGRTVGVLLTDGFDAALLKAVRATVMAQKARVALVAPKVGGVTDRAGRLIPVQHSLAGGPSIFFDAVLVLASEEGAKTLTQLPDAVDWVRDAYRHLKVIGYTPASVDLLEKAGIPVEQEGVGLIRVEGVGELAGFLSVAPLGRMWERESRLEPASAGGAPVER